MSNQGGANFEAVENLKLKMPVENAQEVTEDSGPPPQTLGSEHNMTSSGVASHPLEDILPDVSLEQQELHRVPIMNTKRNSPSGAIPPNTEASEFIKSDPYSVIKNPSENPLASWEDTGAIPKYLTQEYAAKASRYLPPFKKPQSQKPKPKKQPSLAIPPVAELQELPAELQELKRAEVRQELVELQQNSQRPIPVAEDFPQEFQPPEFQEPKPAEYKQEPVKQRRSSRSEQAQLVRQHCLDFQDYKRTVNNKQKSLEQSLNLVLPKMNTAMVDAQNLASKIEKVRNQDCETEEALKIQNDKMKYLVGRTVGTISKIDSLFDRFKTDILEYTTLTTDGNIGIDRKLSKLLNILCGMEDKDPEKEENKVIRDSFEQSDDS